MNDNRIPSDVVVFTLFCLSLLGFFIGGGVFAANVEVSEVLGNIGGLCFFSWWLPALIGLLSRNAIRRLLFTRLGSSAAIIGCVFILAGSTLLFVSALLLTSGPIAPRAQVIGDFCLGMWWIPGLIGVAFCAFCVVCGIDDPIVDSSE